MRPDQLWPEARTERLRRLIEKGKSFTQIGAALGITRGAVAGKCSRLGLCEPTTARPWTQGDDATLYALCRDHRTYAEIGERMGRNMIVVWEHAQRLGLSTGNKGGRRTNAVKAKAARASVHGAPG